MTIGFPALLCAILWGVGCFFLGCYVAETRLVRRYSELVNAWSEIIGSTSKEGEK